MPNSLTFNMPPVIDLLKRWIPSEAKIIIDPFARNSTYGTVTNDLNPDTLAMYHMDALEFLTMLRDKGIIADVVIFDPPYSVSQVKECYNGIGKKLMQSDVWRTAAWSKEKKVIDEMSKTGTIFFYFGWNTTGMSPKDGWETQEIMILNHGACHNDTICTVQRKIKSDV